MNTGNPIGTDAHGVVADLTVYHDSERPSSVSLPVFPSGRREALGPEPAGSCIVVPTRQRTDRPWRRHRERLRRLARPGSLTRKRTQLDASTLFQKDTTY